ncbi:hypothetical protein PFTANZ_00321 [Plasmodium falciparum Tanzania (2000708)]|uniref:Uncharacterized protein n=1 Tax=Plasmodium falciparum Tanzania (2000708) TaxID=1036725 RepID=A0A024WDZ2_PLAFA|nr:hypothetical protein PFTANZ_00321 [Plasmodium falciparum Tanzania (2000708)]
MDSNININYDNYGPQNHNPLSVEEYTLRSRGNIDEPGVLSNMNSVSNISTSTNNIGTNTMNFNNSKVQILMEG